MVWCSHLFNNFPQFVVICTVNSLSVVNKAEVDAFLEFPCFFYEPPDAGNLISGFSALLNHTCTSEISQFTYYSFLA